MIISLSDKSKKLAYLLRHDKQWTPLPGGWREISDLHRFEFSHELIETICTEDKKGRFQLSNDNKYVRALYGHSIKFEEDLYPVEPPPILYHGTALEAKDSILREGLKAMSRRFVHLSSDIPTAIEVAKRHSDNILILKIDTTGMLHKGFIFFNPLGHTWLVSSVPAGFLSFEIISD